jgi:xylulokinase
MSGASCLLALDLGTTTCRCLAFDPQGRPLAEAAREIALWCPCPGYAEADPQEWWSAVCAVTREVLAAVRARAVRPLALGLTGLMHAMVPLAADGQVLGRSMLWMDQRCQPQVEWLNAHEQPTLEAVFSGWGRVTCTSSLPKLRWLAENAPELVAATRHFLLSKDYIRYRLTGALATDASDAGGAMLYDARSGNWSPELVRLAGISLAQLPPILPPSAVVGQVSPQAAALTDLPAGLPVVVGAGDVPATVLGMGGDLPNQAVLYLGTAAWVRWMKDDGHLHMGATATTGAALRWLRDLLGSSYEQLGALAAAIPAGADGLLFLPHLCGERAPFYSPDVRGSVLGLGLLHGRGHLARAVMEGCAFHLRWILEEPRRGEEAATMPPPGGRNTSSPLPQRVVAAGGGARSATWCQLLADVLEAPLRVPAVAEAGALGAALLAALGIGLYASEEQATLAMVHPGPAYAPQVEQRPVYRELYRRFQRAEALMATWREQEFTEQG